MSRLIVLALLCCAMLLDCSKNDEPASAGKTPGDQVPLPAERARAGEAKEAQGGQVREPGAIIDPSFELRASAEGPYPAGKPGRFALTIRPRNEYHINQQFPTSVSMKAPGEIALAKPVLRKADAAAFGEQLVRFEVPFTPAAAGSHQVESRVAFAVCTAKVCVPRNETLTLKLQVE